LCTGRASCPASSPSSPVAWLIINGFCNPFTIYDLRFTIHGFFKVSNIAFPALLGEMAFMLWLLIRGVNVRKWEERAHG
jgi:hypothetical protein